jgi:hypothetical protein
MSILLGDEVMTLEIGLEMPMTMQDNEVVLFVDLSQVQGHSPIEALNTLQSMGYAPDLRLYHWKTDEKERVDACALLHREICADPESVFSRLEAKWEKLSDTFGSSSVFLVMGSD